MLSNQFETSAVLKQSMNQQLKFMEVLTGDNQFNSFLTDQLKSNNSSNSTYSAQSSDSSALIEPTIKNWPNNLDYTKELESSKRELNVLFQNRPSESTSFYDPNIVLKDSTEKT